MNTTTTRTHNATTQRELAPAPRETLQKAAGKTYVKGDTRDVTMNGSFMRLRYLGGPVHSSDSWLVIYQRAATFTRSN